MAVAPMLVMILIVAACSSSGDEASTATTAPPAVVTTTTTAAPITTTTASPTTTTISAVVRDPAAVLADYQEARNSGDVDAVMAFYVEDAVVEDHPLGGDGVATGVLEIRGLEAQVPGIQGSTGGIEYTDIVVSGNTVTFNTKFLNSGGNCFGAAGIVVTVEEGKITSWVYGPGDPSQCE